MPVKYKYDDAYKKYQSFSLRKEFGLLRDYLLLDENHANDEAFAAADEIYHWFCAKCAEVDELRGMCQTFAETGTRPGMRRLRRVAPLQHQGPRGHRLVLEVGRVLRGR